MGQVELEVRDVVIQLFPLSGYFLLLRGVFLADLFSQIGGLECQLLHLAADFSHFFGLALESQSHKTSHSALEVH